MPSLASTPTGYLNAGRGDSAIRWITLATLDRVATAADRLRMDRRRFLHSVGGVAAIPKARGVRTRRASPT